MSKFLIWCGLVFWVFPNMLGLFAEPEDGWYRLFVFILWGGTLIMGPFALTVTSLDAVIKGWLK